MSLLSTCSYKSAIAIANQSSATLISEQGEPITELSLPDESMKICALEFHDKFGILCTECKKIFVYDLDANGEPVFEGKLGKRVSKIRCYSPCRVILLDRDGSLHTLDLTKLSLDSNAITGHFSMVLDLDIVETDTGGVYVATAERDLKVRVASISRLFEVQYFLLGHSAAVTCVKAMSSGLWCTCSIDGSVRVWSTSDGEQLIMYDQDKPFRSILRLNDETLIMSFLSDEHDLLVLTLSNTDSKYEIKLTATVNLDVPCVQMAHLPDAGFVTLACKDKCVRFFKFTEKCLQPVQMMDCALEGLNFADLPSLDQISSKEIPDNCDYYKYNTAKKSRAY